MAGGGAVVAIEVESVLAYEVTRRKKHRPTARLGHVIRTESEGLVMWIAYAIISPTGDSFLGMFETPRKAREAIIDAEKSLRKGDRA
jgi:hypothetical protein